MKNPILLLIIATFSATLFSQKMSIGFIYPAGGQVGTSFEIEVGGLNVTQATEIFISGKGIQAEILKQAENKTKSFRKKYDDQSSPQLADRLKVRITIDKNAEIGLRDFRLQSSNGVSNKLPFEVGQYPDIREVVGSISTKPTVVEALPATLCGQIMPGERDYFSFKVSKGTTLVAAAKARTFVPYIADAVPGWFQAVISLRNSKGQEIAYNDDYRNSIDPVIIAQIPENDTYTLMIQDAIFRGREDFNYRIEVGEIPYIEYIYPAVGKKSVSSKIELKAFNIDNSNVKFKPAFIGKGNFFTTGKNGFKSNTIPFFSFEKSANLLLTPTSNRILPSTIIYDSLRSQSKTVTYNLDLIANEQLTINIDARRLGSMLDARITLYDDTNKKVAEADDTEDALEGLMTHHADPVLNYKALKGGNYKLVIEDVLHRSGPDYFYLLERKTNTPNFKVFVSPATISIPKGGTATFMLDVEAPDKKYPRLDLELDGLPKGFITSSLEMRGNKWEVSVTAPAKAKEQKLDVKIRAKIVSNKLNNTGEMQEAVPADNMMQAFYYTHHIAAASFVAEITKEAPFSLHFSPQIERNLNNPIFISLSDTVFQIKVEIRRAKDFNEPVALQLSRKTKQITLDPIVFLPGETEKVLSIKLDLKDLSNLKGVRRPLAIIGTVNGKVDKKGKRSFENALYREMTPQVIIEVKKE